MRSKQSPASQDDGTNSAVRRKTQGNAHQDKTLKYSERKHEQRITFLKSLRQIITEKGSENLVYVDESGFEANTYRPYAWSSRGHKSYGERSGQRGARTSLIAGKSAPPALRFPQRKDGASRGKQLIAPVLFQGSTNALWFNQWLKEHLLAELPPNSTIILDNAAFHRKNDIFQIAKGAGHSVLFLPPYSPDFNKIEQDFAIIKKRRIYSAPGTSLDDIIKSYGN